MNQRDQIAMMLLPYCLKGWFKRYNHICPSVTEGAMKEAYEEADKMLAFSNEPKGGIREAWEEATRHIIRAALAEGEG